MTDVGSATVPGSFLAGTRRGRIRVAVSDGFGERTAMSGPFVAAGARPRVSIFSPLNGSLIRTGERIILSGAAFDDLDQQLGRRSLTWFAGRRAIGRGARIGARLPFGTRRVRLVARDRTGRTGSATVPVRIQAPQLRIVSVSVPAKVNPNARSMKVRIRTSAPALLTAAGRRYRLRPRQTTLTIRLPRRPAVGVVSVHFRLAPIGHAAQGTLRGTFSVART